MALFLGTIFKFRDGAIRLGKCKFSGDAGLLEQMMLVDLIVIKSR